LCQSVGFLTSKPKPNLNGEGIEFLPCKIVIPGWDPLLFDILRMMYLDSISVLTIDALISTGDAELPAGPLRQTLGAKCRNCGA
jgi:hypothetical protein